ncbi:MAG TPA: long-chain fatty acid--CoA ligase [Kineosporiaceae bacterium]
MSTSLGSPAAAGPAAASVPDWPPASLGLGLWPWRRARIAPGRTALVQGEESLTYAELSDRARRLAAVLAEAGVRRGDRVAYLGPNDIATFVTFFASGLLGAVFAPLNTRLSGPEIRYMLDDCTPAALVHATPLAETLASAGPLNPSVRLTLEVASPSSPGDAFRRAVTAAQPLAEAPPVALDEAALILYTSGTTGRPKGAVLTHGNLTWNTFNQLGHFDTVSTDRALCFSPLFHAVGLGQVSLPTLFKGGSVEVLPRFDAGTVLDLVHRHRITAFAAVPTMLQMMCEHPAWATTDLSSLRYVNYGGSSVPEKVARAWLDRGVQVLQGYGMTEAAPGVAMAIHEGSRERPVSIGMPHFFTDVAGLDAAGPVPLGGEPAELLVRGPNVFAGYLNRPEESAAAFLTGGWFRTGDVVRTDPDGWMYAVDRVKDMIISGGENIYPAEVEAVILQLDGVSSAAVVATPDERWGEVGTAFIQCAPGADLDEATVRPHLEANLARYKIPKYLEFLPDLPRTATGKIRRNELRAVAEEHALQAREHAAEL